MKRMYELAVAYVPEASGEEGGASRVAVEALVTKSGGSITSTEEWGEKSMAYPVRGYDRGVYVVYTVEMEADAQQKLRSQLRHEKGMLRWLMVNATETPTEVAEVAKV
jgi:small subunit ribosomal protein S6